MPHHEASALFANGSCLTRSHVCLEGEEMPTIGNWKWRWNIWANQFFLRNVDCFDNSAINVAFYIIEFFLFSLMSNQLNMKQVFEGKIWMERKPNQQDNYHFAGKINAKFFSLSFCLGSTKKFLKFIINWYHNGWIFFFQYYHFQFNWLLELDLFVELGQKYRGAPRTTFILFSIRLIIVRGNRIDGIRL